MCPIMNFIFGYIHKTPVSHNFFGMPYQPKYQAHDSMLNVIQIEGPIGMLVVLGKVIFATAFAIASEMANYVIDYVNTYQFELATGVWDVVASSINLSTGLMFADFLGKVAYKPLKLSTELDYDGISQAYHNFGI